MDWILNIGASSNADKLTPTYDVLPAVQCSLQQQTGKMDDSKVN